MVDNHSLISRLKDESTAVAKSFTHHQEHFKTTHKERVTDLAQLKSGDHVSFYRSDFSYAHHGIIREARPNYLLIIHYYNTVTNVWNSLIKGSLYLAEVMETEWEVNLDSNTEEIYIHHYDNIECFSNEETVEIAINNLGKRGYSLFGNNCEHWARWCRTGDSYSEQVNRFRHFVKGKSATLLIVDPAALLVKDLAIVGTASLGTFLSAVGSGLILTTVESMSAFIDIKRKHDERRQGSLSEMAFKKYVVRRITSASGTVIGGVTGTIVGTILIPVPILGSIIGGVIGTVSGKVIGGLSGIAISKVFEVFEKQKQEDIGDMETVSELMVNLKRHNNKLFQGLMTYALDSEQEAQVESIVRQATTSGAASSSALYPFFQQLICQYSILTDDQCLLATQLTENIFSDSNDSEYFVLTPLPDENAPEQFASAVDLLVLRWPNGKPQPWNNDEEEHVLDISDLNTESELGE